MTRQTEASIRVLCLDSLPPVLAEEHVCGECTLGAIFALFAALLLHGGSLLLDKGMTHEYDATGIVCKRYVDICRAVERLRTLDLVVVSLGI